MSTKDKLTGGWPVVAAAVASLVFCINALAGYNEATPVGGAGGGDVSKAELAMKASLSGAVFTGPITASGGITNLASTTTKTVVYLNYSTGNDNNDGTAAHPLKTPQAVLNKVPAISFFANFSSYWTGGGRTIDNTGVALSLTDRVLTNSGVYITGPTTTQDSGTIRTRRNNWPNGTSAITDTAKSWTTDQHQYSYLKFTSGAANGAAYPIKFNSSTSITIYSKFATLPAVNDSYEIYTKDAVVSGGSLNISNVGSVTITDLEFSGQSAFHGIQNHSNATYRRCYFHGASVVNVKPTGWTSCSIFNCLFTGTGFGVFPASKAVVTITDSAIQNTAATGIKVQSTSDLWLTRSDVSGATNTGVLVDGSYINANTCHLSAGTSGTNPSDLQLINNSVGAISASLFDGAATYGLYATGGSPVVFSGSSNIITKDGAGKYGVSADLGGMVTGTSGTSYNMTNGAIAEGVNVPTAASYGFID